MVNFFKQLGLLYIKINTQQHINTFNTYTLTFQQGFSTKAQLSPFTLHTTLVLVNYL